MLNELNILKEPANLSSLKEAKDKLLFQVKFKVTAPNSFLSIEIRNCCC